MAANISKETWTIALDSLNQHTWLAEQYGWKIISKEVDEAARKVIIKAERFTKQLEWPQVHFGD